MKTVMIFGDFDGLHESHHAMIRQAKALGDYLIAVVAQDHIIQRLKGQLPNRNLIERFEHLQKVDGVDKVVIGDSELSTWSVVKKHRPDIIALASNQDSLESALRTSLPRTFSAPKIVVLKYSEQN